MGQKWIDNEAAGLVSPEIREQEALIEQQRAMIVQLQFAGHRDVADKARRFLDEMCAHLMKLRLEERASKIRMREDSFSPVSEEQAMEHVIRECPL